MDMRLDEQRKIYSVSLESTSWSMTGLLLLIQQQNPGFRYAASWERDNRLYLEFVKFGGDE